MAEAFVDQDTSYGADNEYRIALIGRTGSGKSATGNNILGRKAFISKSGGSSVTQTCLFDTAERFGKKLVVVDTPGLYDTKLSADVVSKEIIKCVGILSPGPHAFILVVPIGRFTEEEHKTVYLFSRIFGEEIFRNLIVLFTRRDDLENDDRTIQQYVKNVPDTLKTILQRCNNKYLAFDNTKRCQTNEADVQELIGFVKGIMTETGKSYYMNSLFDIVEREFQRRTRAFLLQEKESTQIQEEKEEKEGQLEAEKMKLEEKERELDARERESARKEREWKKKEKEMRDNDRRKYENGHNDVMNIIQQITTIVLPIIMEIIKHSLKK